MAARHRSAQRGNRRSNGLPGWVWLIIGAGLALAVVLLAPGYFKPDGNAGFFRAPPDAPAQQPISALEQPPPAATAPAAPVAAASASTGTPATAPAAAVAEEPDYDFYTVLPAQEPGAAEVADSADAAELAAPRRADPPARQTPAAASPAPASTAPPAVPAARASASAPPPAGESIPPSRPPAPAALPRPPAASTRTPATAPAAAKPAASARPAAATPAATTTAPADNTRVVLQAGAFRAADDAEALKAKIALLGLQARVETATVDGQDIYRVRLGPYPGARELGQARQRLDDGGLPSREIREP